MKGFPIGSLCVLVRAGNPANVGGIVEIIGPATYEAYVDFYGNKRDPCWLQNTCNVTTFKNEFCFRSADPIANMRLLSDPDKAPVEEKEVTV